MKRIILILMVGIFLTAIVTSAIIGISKDITFTKEQKDALTSINLEDYNTIDYSLGIDGVERCLKKENAINTCKKFKTYYITCLEYDEEDLECKSEQKIYYTEQEMINILDDWEKERLKLIAEATISRKDNQKEIIREGVTSVK